MTRLLLSNSGIKSLLGFGRSVGCEYASGSTTGLCLLGAGHVCGAHEPGGRLDGGARAHARGGGHALADRTRRCKPRCTSSNSVENQNSEPDRRALAVVGRLQNGRADHPPLESGDGHRGAGTRSAYSAESFVALE